MMLMTWVGTRDIVDRLIQGYDPRLADDVSAPDAARMNIPLATMSLIDCGNPAGFLIGVTTGLQGFSVDRVRGVGGPIDIAAITAGDGARFLYREDVTPGEPELRIVGPAPAAVIACPLSGGPSTYTVAGR